MLKLYKKYLPKYKLHLIFGPLFKILEAIFELVVPLVIKYMIDNIINNNLLAEQEKIIRIWKCGGILLGFAICGFITTMIAQYIAARASQGFGTDLRNDLYRHINSFSYKELDKFTSASLINRLQNDVLNVQNSVAMIIRLVLRAPFIVIGATIMSFIVNIIAGLIFLGATILLFLIIFIIGKLMLPYSKKMQNELDNVTKVSKENLSGSRVVRAFNKESYEKNRFINIENKLTKICISLSTREALLNPLIFLLVNVASIIVLYLSGIQFTKSGITQGDIQALINYFTQIQIAVVAVTTLVMIFSKAASSGNRVIEVLEMNSSIKYGEIASNNLSKTAVEFKNVFFSYNDNENYAIKNLNMKINKGETIGIIGSTGSGKSTVVNLINRYYDSSKGEILLFNKNIKYYSKDYLFKNIATVSQKSVLFKGSIKNNLLKANKDASDEDISNALKISQAYDFVKNKNNGIDSEIYQLGKNLSGGQKQRLSIARALLKDAPILILDDSSSALDYQTDSKIRKEIYKLNKTTIIISQRIRSIINADKIFVFENGSLVGEGNHAYLLKNNKVYQEIAASQDYRGNYNV